MNCHCGGRAVLLNCVEPTTNGGRPCFWWYTKNGSSGGTEDVPYTASLDAAMGLVPEGWTGLNDNTSGTWIVELFPPDFDPNDWNLRPIQRAKHKSFALALCAAALRARAAQDVSQ